MSEHSKSLPKRFYNDMSIDHHSKINTEQSTQQNQASTADPASIETARSLIRDQELPQVRPGFYAQLGSEKSLQRCFERKISIDHRIDVHGYRLTDCFERVIALLDEAINQHWRLIHLICGKGTGLLKTELSQYLIQRHDIIGVCQAPDSLGGSGALLILLKKKGASQ